MTTCMYSLNLLLSGHAALHDPTLIPNPMVQYCISMALLLTQ